MTRVSRTRTRPYVSAGKRLHFNANGSYSYTENSTVNLTSTISDYHGRPVISSPMSSTQYSGEMFINGKMKSAYNTGGNTVTEYQHWPVAASAGSLDTTPLSPPSGWYLDLVAGTNPSRPVFTPPTLIQDFIDIPGQLRQLGKLFHKPKSLMSPKELANHQLCVQFGWLPLIDDVKQLLNLQSYVLKRTKELHDLYSARGLGRRLKFGEANLSGEGVYRVAEYGPDNYCDFPYDIFIHKKSWATIRWKPITVPDWSHSDVLLNRKAYQLVLGLTLEGMGKGLWDVLPWTWLIGWFTNFGKYLLAFSNTVPAQHSEGNFMSESRRIYVPKVMVPHNLDMKVSQLEWTGVYTAVTKTRIVSGSLTPGFNMPFLDMFRLSVLGALFVQRTLR